MKRSADWGPFLVKGFTNTTPKNDIDNEIIYFHPSIQVSIHNVTSASFLNELKMIFSNESWNKDHTIIISTMQHASVGLVNYDTEVDQEKDVLLENFAKFAEEVCKIFEQLGIFADYFDPCSGLPAIRKDCNQVFSEVQAAQVLHNYQVMNAGCCKILMHPEWGSAVYPASIVIKSTLPEVLNALQNRLILEESSR